jgi:phosphate transport system protein
LRESFHRELEKLDQDIVRMGALVERNTQSVTSALIECDHELARTVRDSDAEIDALYVDIERRALTLLAQQAPVAGDLRLIVAILRVINDLERSGDLVYNIAKLALLEDFRQPQLKAVRGLLADLGEEAAKLVGAAIDAWAAKDERMAADITLQDDILDDIHARLIEQLLRMRGDDALPAAIRSAMIGRYLERIGDHAVNLAERVRYFVTGSEEYLG